MNGLRKFVGFLTVLMLTGGALFSGAALAAEKQYALDAGIGTYLLTDPVSSFVHTGGVSPATVTIRVTNLGNSSYNSFTVAIPDGSGYQIQSSGLSSSRGTPSVISGGAGVQVIDINLPSGTGQFVDLTMTVVKPGCGSAAGNWTAVVYTGTPLTGQRFRLAGGNASTSVGTTCWTLTYSAGAGGTLVGTSPQTVADGGSGTPVSVTVNSAAGYVFTGWSDGRTTNSRTDTNVTGDVNVTAQYTGTISFSQQPHNALAGGRIGPVTVKGMPASMFSGKTASLTVTSPTVGSSATLTGDVTNVPFDAVGEAHFDNIGTAADSSVPGPYHLTATTNLAGAAAVDSADFSLGANQGILTCPNDPDPPLGSVTGFDTGSGSVIPTKGDRLDNKDGSLCSAVPFKVTVTADTTNHAVNVLWDELSQPYTVLKIETVWPPERSGADLLPKPTLYNVGGDTYTSGLCLKKTPFSLAAYGTAGPDPDGPPEEIGTFTGSLDAISGDGTPTASIAITFNGKQPATYLTRSFSIIIPSSSGADPERMLVTGETSPGSGVFNVLRGTGKTVKSAHTGTLKVMWTPLPVADNSGTNAPPGAQVPVCIIEETSATVSTDLCSAWTGTGEPPPCLQPKSKLWAIGDLTVSRTP